MSRNLTSPSKLPVRMYFKHGAYYYVYKNKWTRLGADYADALRHYAGIIAPNNGKMSEVIDRWLGKITIAENTKRSYDAAAKRLKTAFEEFAPKDIKPYHFYQYIAAKGFSDATAHPLRTVMVGAMNLAVEEGLVERNLMREVKNYRSNKRDRYITDDEYKKLYDSASPTIKAVMEICLFTGQRIGDVLAIKYSDLTSEGIVFKQQKTGERLCIRWNPDLEAAVAQTKALHTSIKGMTLFHTRAGKEFSRSTIVTLWLKAVARSGIQDVHLHDLRAKAATDAKKQGLDSKALLGHRSDATHEIYMRDKTTPVVDTLRRKS